MSGPPCHNCGSEKNWLPGKDGEQCACGWPDNKNNLRLKNSFGDSALGEGIGCASIIFALLSGLALCIYVANH